MKTVEMLRDYDYRPHPMLSVHFEAGLTYRRVLEYAARDIERVGAGRIVGGSVDATGATVVDAWNAWQRRRRPS